MTYDAVVQWVRLSLKSRWEGVILQCLMVPLIRGISTLLTRNGQVHFVPQLAYVHYKYALW
jgi:hypothetical protein